MRVFLHGFWRGLRGYLIVLMSLAAFLGLLALVTVVIRFVQVL